MGSPDDRDPSRMSFFPNTHLTVHRLWPPLTNIGSFIKVIVPCPPQRVSPPLHKGYVRLLLREVGFSLDLKLAEGTVTHELCSRSWFIFPVKKNREDEQPRLGEQSRSSSSSSTLFRTLSSRCKRREVKVWRCPEIRNVFETLSPFLFYKNIGFSLTVLYPRWVPYGFLYFSLDGLGQTSSTVPFFFFFFFREGTNIRWYK